MKQTILTKLAQLLRVAPGDVEDVLRNDEARARDTVNRRRFMGAAAALASAPFVPKAWALPLRQHSLLDNVFDMTRLYVALLTNVPMLQEPARQEIYAQLKAARTWS